MQILSSDYNQTQILQQIYNANDEVKYFCKAMEEAQRIALQHLLRFGWHKIQESYGLVRYMELDTLDRSSLQYPIAPEAIRYMQGMEVYIYEYLLQVVKERTVPPNKPTYSKLLAYIKAKLSAPENITTSPDEWPPNVLKENLEDLLASRMPKKSDSTASTVSLLQVEDLVSNLVGRLLIDDTVATTQRVALQSSEDMERAMQAFCAQDTALSALTSYNFGRPILTFLQPNYLIIESTYPLSEIASKIRDDQTLEIIQSLFHREPAMFKALKSMQARFAKQIQSAHNPLALVWGYFDACKETNDDITANDYKEYGQLMEPLWDRIFKLSRLPNSVSMLLAAIRIALITDSEKANSLYVRYDWIWRKYPATADAWHIRTEYASWEAKKLAGVMFFMDGT